MQSAGRLNSVSHAVYCSLLTLNKACPFDFILQYGTINYTYDRENCLLTAGSRGEVYVTYTYDKMGNLLTEESPRKVTKYAYNAQNRLIYCEVTDKVAMEYSQSTYAYDAFGRRILVQDRAEATLRTLYDGLTFDVIKQSPTLANGMFTDSFDTGIHYSRTGRPTGDRYRYISDEEAHFGERYRYIDDNTYKIVNGRYRGERTQISVNGSIAAQATSEGMQYFSTDLLGSVASVTDNYGNWKAGYSYDAFGSLVNGDLSGSTDFGYLGKQNDTTGKLYNYGYRDYKTQLARFTTVDPIRDGTNWLVYCNGDAVNFVDLWGLQCEKGVDKDDAANTNSDLLGNRKGIDISEDPNQDLILQALNQLTDDKLGISNGRVIIEKYRNGQKKTGTQLLRYLIDETDKTIKISTIEPQGANNSITITYKFNEDSTEYDAFNGIGLNSQIIWSLGEPLITEIDDNGNISDQYCPTYISLGHELIHAYHNAKGENKGMYVYGVYSSRKEEYTTKFDPELSENTLRLENGLNKRYK